MIKTKCGVCGVRFSYPESKQAKTAKCPKCSTLIILATTFSPTYERQQPPELPASESKETAELKAELRELKQAVLQSQRDNKVQSKNMIAAVVNVFLPGVGQFIQGRFIEGLIWILFLGLYSMVVGGLTGFNPLIFPIGFIAIWFLCILNAVNYRPKVV